MMQRNKDPRVQRTCILLREALLDLLDEKRFEAITVADISERAKVNRATFYRHYQDKYDLVVQIFEGVAEELVSELNTRIQQRLINLDDPPAVWARLFHYFAEHARLYRALLGKTGTPWLVTQAYERFAGPLLKSFRAMRPAGSLSKMPEEVATTFALHLLIGVVAWWLEYDMPYSPEQMASWFVRFVSQGYFHVLGLETIISTQHGERPGQKAGMA
jgi:AcrR family transcriptional regulator